MSFFEKGGISMIARNLVVAESGMRSLRENPYPGRGIVMGVDDAGENVVQVYWIMGRSENSRNRVFNFEGGRLFTEAADPSKVKDPSLIIYNAMQESREFFVVSNGSQTDVVLGHPGAESLQYTLRPYQYEPDSPNFTPRITGSCYFLHDETPFFQLAVLRKSLWSGSCDRSIYNYEKIGDGFGFCITTYSGDGDPLPSFVGDPILMPLLGGIGDIATTYWDALNEQNRVSLAVKFIRISSMVSTIRVINKFPKI